MTAISLTPGLIEVTIYGGSPYYDPNMLNKDMPRIAETTILTLSECALHVY